MSLKPRRRAGRRERFGQSRGQPPGALHQGVNLLHRFTDTGDPASTDRFGWVVDGLGTPTLDWADGDGLNPFVGPILVAAGTPTAGLGSPWITINGTRRTCTGFVAGDNYTSATVIDPPATQDMVIRLLAYLRRTAGATVVLLATSVGVGANNDVWELRVSGALNVTFQVSDGVGNVSSVAATTEGWHLIDVVYDASGNQRLYITGVLGDTDAVAGLGVIGPSGGLGINSRPAGVFDELSCIARVMVFYGAGIADVATGPYVLQATQVATGLWPAQGAAGVFARATGATWQDSTGIWHLAGDNLARAGDNDGLRLAPARTNQAWRNFDPQPGNAAAILTVTGGVVSEVDDTAALTAAGALEWGPSVYQFANATGGVQYCRMSQQTGDVNARSLQAMVRRSAGVGAVSLGLYDESAGTFVAGAAINDNYVRTLVHGQVPADTDCTLCLEVADATTVRFIGHDMSTGPRCTTPVHNPALAVTETRNAEVFTTSDTPDDATGGFSLEAEPMGWSAAETGGASVVGRAGGGNAMLYVTAAGVWELDLDGTTLVTSTASPADGVSQRVDVRWSSGGVMTLAVDGTVWSAAYDGTVQNAGAWELELDGGEMAIRNFTTYRNGSG
jgi:hypothetical protein